jgi:hypothetical protein
MLPTLHILYFSLESKKKIHGTLFPQSITRDFLLVKSSQIALIIFITYIQGHGVLSHIIFGTPILRATVPNSTQNRSLFERSTKRGFELPISQRSELGSKVFHTYQNCHLERSTNTLSSTTQFSEVKIRIIICIKRLKYAFLSRVKL